MTNQRWNPDQFWEYAAALVGEFEADQMRDTMNNVGLLVALRAAAAPAREQIIRVVLMAHGFSEENAINRGYLRDTHALALAERVADAVLALTGETSNFAETPFTKQFKTDCDELRAKIAKTSAKGTSE